MGLVSIASVLARPIPELLAPIVSWDAGEPMPDFGPIAYHLRHRFSSPVKNVPIVVSLPAAANRMGGHPGRVAETIGGHSRLGTRLSIPPFPG